MFLGEVCDANKTMSHMQGDGAGRKTDLTELRTKKRQEDRDQVVFPGFKCLVQSWLLPFF